MRCVTVEVLNISYIICTAHNDNDNIVFMCLDRSISLHIDRSAQYK